MPKYIKFASKLVPLILSGEKTATWRLWDDKDLREGDELVFLESGQAKPFARAVIATVAAKTFGRLASEDKFGHEDYASDEEMYETYSGYYGKPVDQNTPIKIIRFTVHK
ncbi:MAG: ASCH domain-containing protein [Patescibacteria group bacterium]|jgi:hypothetical protein